MPEETTVHNRVDTFAVAAISILYSRGANRSRQRSTGSWKDVYCLEIAIEGHFLGVAEQTASRVSSSKVHRFKISQFLFSRNRPGREKREYLHHAKISRYTVPCSIKQIVE